MSVYTIEENLPRESWNSFLERCSPTGNLQQSFEFGEIARKAFQRTNVVRLACKRKEEVVGVVQGIYSKHLGFGMSLAVRYGPVVNFELNDYIHFVDSLLKALDNYAGKNRIIEASVFVPKKWRFDSAFHRFGYSRVNQYNEYFVSLENSADKLWRKISHNKRKNVKKAISENVEVFESTKIEDLFTFYSMVKAAEERGGFTSYPINWFKTALQVCNPEHSKIFIAKWNGKPVSGVFTVMHGKTVYALAAGSFKEAWKVRPNDILHWKAMEWACGKGFLRYHMGLVSDPTPKEGSNTWGVWRWKREWNGNLNPILAYHKYFKPKYRFVLKAKKAVEKLIQA